MSDLTPAEVSRFLNGLQVSPSGQVFIIERDGRLVGSSQTQPILQQGSDAVDRLNVANSPDPIAARAIRRSCLNILLRCSG
ncbi:MAG: hypothetical protein F6K28_49745 [Microcoleus sp. SIO2G3]|nr:hypothetical protein [Microcoleus sp. SIO2G3]